MSQGATEDAGASPVRVGPGLLSGIFLVSVATLHLEILQTRIFSVLLWHHVTYLVVTFTLLGFAASGTFLTLFPGLLRRRPLRFLGWTSLGFALTTHAAFQVLGRSELDTLALLSDRRMYLVVFAYYLYLVAPYFLAGLVIVGGLNVAGRRSGTLYASNLAGSALGCLVFAFTLSPFGGPAAVFLGAGLAALGAVAFARAEGPGRGRGMAAAGWLVGLGSLALAPWADRLLPVEAAPSKVMMHRMAGAAAAGQDVQVLETRWDPLCRIDVVDLGEPHEYQVYQDADAPTTIFGAEHPPEWISIYTFPYLVIGPDKDVLIVGVGGGHDVRVARWAQARSITGVEINRSTAALLRGPFAEYSGRVYETPAPTAEDPTPPPVEVVVTEGRSFIRRTERTFDQIQMTGTDTYAALSSGSYVLSESYLYTVEAFLDYFDHLTGDGVVSVLRFRFFPPRESLRLMAIAVEAMRQRGIERPEQHVLAMDHLVRQPVPGRPDQEVTIAYTAMLFKKTPFTAAQIQMARDFDEKHPEKERYALAYAPGVTDAGDPVFRDYFGAVAAGTDDAFRAAYEYQVDPVDDDSPFFFNFHRLGSLWDFATGDRGGDAAGPAADADAGETYLGAIGQDPVGLLLLGTALLESALLVVLLVLLPLVLSRRTRLPRTRRGPVFLYFLGLGVGFLFLEIACMQRLALYLGHPTRSITVVLFSFLLFSGLGSFVADRLPGRRVGPWALAAVLVLIAGYALFLDEILDRTLGETTQTRVLLAGALLAVPSFFMGMPFPRGIRRLQGDQLPFLPWAFAINGGASVVASVAAIFLAMAGGFTTVFWCAFAFYLCAFLAAFRLPVGAGAKAVESAP